MKLKKIIKNKKAGLGEIMTTFVATIVIVVILGIFVLLSFFVKTVGGVYEGITIVNETQVGITNMRDYSLSFAELVNLRYCLAGESFSADIFDFEKIKEKNKQDLQMFTPPPPPADISPRGGPGYNPLG